MLEISVVVGNPKPESRTGQIAKSFATRLFHASHATITVFDLAAHTDELLKWPSIRMAQINAFVASSSLVVFASPTYKASYTGLLKSFLDRYPAGGLKGTVAVALMTGADSGHSMAPTVNLVPLLLELGATVPIRGLYFSTSHMDRVDGVVDGYVAEFHRALSQMAAMREAETGLRTSPSKEVA